MNIAHVISTFPPYKGGMGNSVLYSALEIGKLGHRVTIFTPAYSAEVKSSELIGENVTVVRLKPLFSIGNAAILPQLAYKLWDFDIIHLHYPFYGTADFVALIALWRRLFGKQSRLLMRYHMDTVGRGIKGFIFALYKFFLLPVIIRVADIITCSTIDYVKHSDLSAYYQDNQNKFIQVPFGVNAEKFRPPHDCPREKMVIFVGGLDKAHYFKGVEQLIRAFARVCWQYPGCKLMVVGKGELEDYYKKLARDKKIEDKFEIRNSVSDEELVSLYCKSSVLVLPSINKSEAFGLVLLEAMACGTPVIASNLPGVRSVFRNNEHGLLVQPGNIDDLAQKLEIMLSSEELATDMGRSARRWIEEKYSWQRVGQELEAIYLRMLHTPIEILKPQTKTQDEDIINH